MLEVGKDQKRIAYSNGIQDHAKEILQSRRNNQYPMASGNTYQSGQTSKIAARGIGISEQTYYRWKKEYGVMRTDQDQRPKELEQENSRLKRIVANLSQENMIIKEVLKAK